ncbi:hypothetical protein AHF37_03732 [Paragonimus kellicotti]|nr:hypothetical protein AHF37_03732 [Paragonimus kellicotti]
MSFTKYRHLPRKIKYFLPVRAVDESVVSKDVLKHLDFKPMKSISFSFNPFVGNVESIRTELQQWKYSVVDDRKPFSPGDNRNSLGTISPKRMSGSADVAERESISAEDSDEWEEIFDAASSNENRICFAFYAHMFVWERLFSVEHCFISDQYDWIRFVNYVRLKKPDDFRQVFHDPSWNSKSEDSFRPVLDNDAVLSIDIEAILEEHGLKPSGDSNSITNEHSHIDIANILEENRLLREPISRMQEGPRCQQRNIQHESVFTSETFRHPWGNVDR